jgi:hypothetical protein
MKFLLSLLIMAASFAIASPQLWTLETHTGTNQAQAETALQNTTVNHPHYNSYFDWGRGMNGWGYCYQWTPYGVPMNEGRPVPNFYCERHRPSFYRWAQGQNGYIYCYQFTPDGYVMNEGRPVDNRYCRYHQSIAT